MQMERTTEKEILSEVEKVYRHRVVCFLVLGYSMDESEVLAASDIDHHDVERLIEKGCERATAARILV